MQELEIGVLIAVFLEIMGPAFWVLLAVAILTVALFGWSWLREKGLSSRRLVAAEGIGVLGGFFALWLMAWFTLSGFTDAGGPIDWLVIAGVWGVGLVGTTILSYGVMGTLGWLKAK